MNIVKRSVESVPSSKGMLSPSKDLNIYPSIVSSGMSDSFEDHEFDIEELERLEREAILLSSQSQHSQSQSNDTEVEFDFDGAVAEAEEARLKELEVHLDEEETYALSQ